MELYYAPLACSLASHITCREAALDIALRRVDLSTKRSDDGATLFDRNPMGQVPTLACDDGRILTENVSVLLFLADRAAERGLAPDPSARDRYDVLSWLSFVATELHAKVAAAIFALDAPPDVVKDHARARAQKPLAALDHHLANRDVLVGSSFTVADAYLLWATTVLPFANVSLDAFPAVRAHHARHLSRPAVKAALQRERREYGQPLA
jgi:glutathione S-transferase